MKKIAPLGILLSMLISILACSGSAVTDPETFEGDHSVTPTNVPETQITGEINPEMPKNFRPIADLESDIIYQISFAIGGASGCENTVGLLRSYPPNFNDLLTLNYEVYRQSAESGAIWSGDKTSEYYDQIEFGDMVYFNAYGFEEGEQVTYTIHGPNDEEAYKSTVNYGVAVDYGMCNTYLTTPVARLEWVADPKFGIGKFFVTASGNSGNTQIELAVTKNSIPTFGAVFGKTSVPVTLGNDQKIHIVYAGFQPNETVTTILLKSTNALVVLASAVGYIETQVGDDGNGQADINWDPSFGNGDYWLLVPNIIPKSEFQPDGVYGTWGIQFFTSERFSDLFKNTQDVLLRPSCEKELTAKAGQTIHLNYGIWGANGQDILNQTKDKIITKLFISDEYSRMEYIEVTGSRSNSNIPMSQIPCGNELPNGYFMINETQIGPYRSGNEIKIRVDYSFSDTITDGYDLSPTDGVVDVYGPDTPFSQAFTIRIIPDQ